MHEPRGPRIYTRTYIRAALGQFWGIFRPRGPSGVKRREATNIDFLQAFGPFWPLLPILWESILAKRHRPRQPVVCVTIISVASPLLRSRLGSDGSCSLASASLLLEHGSSLAPQARCSQACTSDARAPCFVLATAANPR
eukprot:6903282-Pyramimonas_sp.AAC.1